MDIQGQDTTAFNAIYVGDIQDRAIRRLKSAGIESSRLEADLIVSSVTGIDRVTLFSHPEITISPDMVSKIESMLNKRMTGYPLAYLIGEWEFYGIRFEVREGILIPRDDTETLIECAVEILDGRECRIADLGCGSGCISVALAWTLPGLAVDAYDISDTAVEVTKRNVERQKLANRVSVYKKDMFAALNDTVDRYDAVVSNPPYIETDAIAGLQPEISLYEPKEALDGGIDGLKYYPGIFSRAFRALKPGGFAAVEVGIGQAGSVCDIAAGCGFNNIRCVNDLAGIDRVVLGYK